MKNTLLIIDVQNGFINNSTKHIPSMVQNLQYKYEHVIVTKFYNKENSLYRKLINWNKFGVGTKDTELAFTPIENALIIEKPVYTCVNRIFKNYIKNNKIKEIDICGLDTDICVTKCAVDIFEFGIIPNVLGKYCASHGGKGYHDFALNILKRYIGRSQVKE